MTKITVLYLPGLGGNYDLARKFIIRLWPRTYNARLLPLDWTDKNESFDQKKARLRDEISKAEGQVVLVGESAGASMGLILAHENPDLKFIGFCGKIGGAKSTGDFYFRTVPAFASMLPQADELRGVLTDNEKSRMMVVRAYKDIFLSLRDNTIPGVQQIVLPSLGHLTTIFLGITVLRYGIFRAIKQLTKSEN